MITGDQIAADALKWTGQGYVFGGNASRPGDWDCSSFASFVLGHDLKLSLPGGKWGGAGMPPGSHGPVVDSYASWKGAVTVQSPARGDLVLFVGQGADGHMGIVLGPDQMVSALDSASGTLVTPITGYGPPGAPIVYRRVVAAAAGSAATAVSTGTAGLAQPVLAALATLGIVGGMAAIVVLGAALLGAGLVVAGTLAMARLASR